MRRSIDVSAYPRPLPLLHQHLCFVGFLLYSCISLNCSYVVLFCGYLSSLVCIRIILVVETFLFLPLIGGFVPASLSTLLTRLGNSDWQAGFVSIRLIGGLEYNPINNPNTTRLIIGLEQVNPIVINFFIKKIIQKNAINGLAGLEKNNNNNNNNRVAIRLVDQPAG
jgi:hypothetical protein